MSVRVRQGTSCPSVDHPLEGSPINGSVGIGGNNARGDVKMIQQLLNSLSPLEGGPNLYLKEDSISGPKTHAAITKYQNAAFGGSDGRIDANGRTIKSLVNYIETSPTIPYGSLGAPSLAAQTSSTPNTGLTPSKEGADSIALAIIFMRLLEPRLGSLRWKLTHTTPGMMGLLNKHFAMGNNKVKNSDVGHVQKILGAIHQSVARFNVFAKLPVENVILYDPKPPGVTIAYTVRGGNKMSTKQIQIYVEKNGVQKLPGQSIWLTSLFADAPSHEKHWAILHEFCHYVGPRDGFFGTIDDNGYANEPKFLKLSKFNKLHNAESLSLFFLEYCIGTQAVLALPRSSSVKSHLDAFPKVTSTGDIVTS